MLLCQQYDIDSLRHQLTLDLPDSTRVEAYWLISSQIAYSDAASAIEYADSSLSLANEIDWEYGVARAMYSMGLGYDFAGETEKSIEYFERAKAIFQKLDERVWEGNCINSIGVCFYYAGDQNRALEKYLEALEHWEEIDHKLHASKTLNNIGVIYRAQSKHEQAIDIYHKSLALKQELGDQRGIAFTYRNLGVAHSYLGDETKAIEYCKEAISLLEELEEFMELSSAYGSLATSYLKIEKYVEAEEAIDECLQLAATTVDGLELPTIYATTAAIKNRIGKPDEALKYSDMAIQVLQENPDNVTLRDCYKERATALGQLGRFEEASSSWQIAYERTLEISDSARVKEMAAMQAQFDVKQKEQDLEISNLKLAEKERQETIFIWGFVAAGLLLLLAIAFVYYKVRNNARLREKNSIIQNSLEEKEVLLREIHHRVKNNLQVISSLLSIQSREISDEVALEAVNESRNRVKSMAIIHQNLYKEDNLTGIDVGDYIEKLSRSLFASYRVDSDVIILKTDVDHLNLDVDTAIPLGLILNELITNALKYAFTGREEGRLEVSLKEVEGVLELVVADDGVGVSTPKESLGDSFGMKMIDAFAQKLGAEWSVEDRNGTKVQLRISNYQKAV